MSESPYRWIQETHEKSQHTKVRFPFKATINETEVTVWPDWIEWPYGPERYEPDHDSDYELND